MHDLNNLINEQQIILDELHDEIELQKSQIEILKENNKLLKAEVHKLLMDQDRTLSMYKEINRKYNNLKFNYKLLSNKEKQVVEFAERAPIETNSKEDLLKFKNERAADRKLNFTDIDKKNIKMYKMQGLNSREILEIFKYGHVRVSKLNKNKLHEADCGLILDGPEKKK